MILTVTLNACLDKFYILEKMRVGEINRPESVTVSAGGKGVNVSRVCKRLGVDITTLTLLGGHTGRWISSLIDGEQLNPIYINADGESRVNVKIKELFSGKETALNEPGIILDSDSQRFIINKISEALDIKSIDAAVFAGSLPRGASTDLYSIIIKTAKAKGIYTALDTSGKYLADAIAGCPDIIKPNIEEAEDLLGESIKGHDDARRAILKMMDMGPKSVILTMGKQGATAGSRDDGIYEVHIPEVEAVNTVGCGDSFLAGFLSSRSAGRAFGDSIRFGCACSISSATSTGIADIDKQQVQSLLKDIYIKRMQ